MVEKLSKKEKDEVFELIKDLLKKFAGKNNEAITPLLFEKKNVNEFKLATKLKLTINQVRNILYKMLEYNILSSTRKKDKKKGWYTYYWTLETDKALEALKKIKQQEIKVFEQLRNSRQIKKYYTCPSGCLELTTETAMLYNFSCPECGELLHPCEEEKRMKEVVSKIDSSKKELEIINYFLSKFEKKPEIKVKPVKKVVKKKKKVKKRNIKKRTKKTKKKKRK